MSCHTSFGPLFSSPKQPSMEFAVPSSSSPSLKIHSLPKKQYEGNVHSQNLYDQSKVVAVKRTHSSAIGIIHQPEVIVSSAPKEKEEVKSILRKKEGMGLDERIKKSHQKMERKEKCKEQYLQRQKEREEKTSYLIYA